MDIFKRPYLDDKKILHFPYEAESLKKHPIFPYYIMDGGAYYVIRELLGESWDGDKIAELVMNGKLFDAWSENGAFDWDLPQKQYCKSKVGAPVEKHVWMNRLYFLMPLASQFLKTGEESYVEKWYEYFRSWVEAYPSQKSEESDDWVIKNVWREMQVAWRLLSVVHGVAMLADSSTLTEDRWDEIYDFICLNTEQLLKEGKGHIKKRSAHNHVLQIGVALLYVGILFPEFEHSEEYKKVGREIVEIQLEGAIYPDGGSYEDSTSYSLFIARLYIECALLLQKNHMKPIEGLLECVAKQYEWIYQMSTRKGDTILMNDSYGTSVLRELEYVKELIPLTLSEKKSVIFEASKCAVLRNENFDIYIDGMDHSQWHQHAGRPHFIVYFKEEPLIVDSGCCGYDHHSMHQYLWGEWAHNTVCMHMKKHPDKTLKPVDEVEMLHASAEERYVEYRITGSRDGVRFSRTRKIELLEDSIQIIDTIHAEQETNIEVLLHFAPLDMVAEAEWHRFTVHPAQAGCDIVATFSGDVDASFLDYNPAINEKTEFTYAPVAVAERFEKDAVIKTVIKIAM